jgi:hypothetical protein
MGKAKSCSIIPYGDLKSVKIFNTIFGMGKMIFLHQNDNKKMSVTINKSALGIKKQEENFIAIIEKLQMLPTYLQ